MRIALQRLGPNFVAFTSGACVMIVELVAGRILAPYIGVSLYTWTSIIGIVMAGISLGNFVGGKIADRYPSTATLGLAFFASGLATLGILPATAFMGGFSFPFEIHVVDKIVAHVAAIFFAPAFVLGVITPSIVKLALRDLKRTGGTVGAIYASNCVGSILGTFATGFWLISWLGTRTVVWLVALTLILLGVAFGESWKGKRWLAALAAIAVFGIALNFRQEWRAPADVESNYYSISITNRSVENQAVKSLTLDYLIHSHIQVGNPLFLGYSYNKIFAEIAHYLRQNNEALRALFVGGGGYSFPRYMEVVYPHAEIDVIEIDPAVTKVVYDDLGMPRTTRIRTFNMDARLFFIDNLAGGAKYDVIFGDAFNDLSIPYHLTTHEFNQHIKSNLKEGGFYVANVIDDFREGKFLPSYIHTLRGSFKNVYLLREARTGEVKGRDTHIVVASNTAIDRQAFAKLSGEKGSVVGEIIEDNELEQYLREKSPVVLTDDYAPVDNMVAPIFAKRT